LSEGEKDVIVFDLLLSWCFTNQYKTLTYLLTDTIRTWSENIKYIWTSFRIR